MTKPAPPLLNDSPIFTSWHELPPTPDALRAECERLRCLILDNAALARPALTPSLANVAAIVKGTTNGFILPPLERLFLAARKLALNNLPPFAGEPQTALEAVAALDSLLTTLRPAPGDAPAAETKGKPKRRRRGRPADTDAKEDRRIFDAWNFCLPSGKQRYRTYAELACELTKEMGMKISAKQVGQAIDRERKRRNPDS